MRKLNKFLFILLTVVLPLSLAGIVFFALSDIYRGDLDWARGELWAGVGIGVAMWSLWIARIITGLTVFKDGDKNDRR